jgi:hypothetical protein
MLMITLLFLLICVCTPVASVGTNRTYLIKKDFVSGLKSGEFTVYDSTGKIRQYRIESKFGLTHDVRVVTLPSKKLLARLKGKVTAVMYKADITIFDNDSQKWVNGTMEQNYKLVGNKFTILWDGERMSMEGTGASLSTAFVGQSIGEVLGKFQKRVTSLFWRNKYDLQILSDKFPDTLYFLGVAARDHSNKKIHRG